MFSISFIHTDRGCRYIAEWEKTETGRKIKRIKSLGRISKEQAEQELILFKKQLEIKPIYRTIVIDPPWPMEKIPRNVRPNQKVMDYQTMPVEEIKKFPLQKFVSKDGAHVYLWTTHKYLPDAFDVLKIWGVNYQCVLTWIKNVGITPFSWMYSTELVLFGRIGNIDIVRKGLRIDFKADVREHSRKPEIFYDLVRRASPDPRIDIFSREKHDGFDSYGYETSKFD